MKLLIISHKEIWKSYNANSNYETSGGFPLQIKAMSNLFSETYLLCGLSNKYRLNNLTPLTGTNLNIFPIEEPPFSGHLRKISILFWLPINIKKIWSIIKYSDAVHILIPGDIGLIGLILALIVKKPIFVRHCGTWGNDFTITDKFIHWLLPKIANGKNIIMATGGGAEVPEKRNSNIKWIYSTSITNVEWNSLLKKSKWEKGNKLKLITVGRLSKKKNTESIILSLVKLKEKVPLFHLDIIGDGVEMDRLKDITSKLSLNDKVTFHGNKNHRQVLDILSKSHLFLFPTNVKEGFPKVMVEAMACGLPTIASRVSVIPYLIENRCGIILENTSPESIFKATNAMIENPQKMVLMGEKARLISSKYTLENWQEYIGTALYKQWGPLK